jgi:predicted dehydrogenase
MKPVRAAVVGAGSFGRNHVRVIHQLENVELAAVVDSDLSKAQQLASEFESSPFASIDQVIGHIDAAIVATPTVTHERVAAQLIEAGVDVLVEKPIAESAAAGDRLASLAREHGRILQVGHLERFNPAVAALQNAVTIPLFFEVHRLSVFSPRSLDIDVVLDLMIHDLDIVLSFTGEQPVEIRAAGISVLSKRVDIANVRLSFASGCIANLTASRVSTEQVRKLRLFQPGEYISLDYQRQDAVRLAIRKNEPNDGDEPANLSEAKNQAPFVRQNRPQIGYDPLPVAPGEPLRLELEAFFRCVRDRSKPRVDGFEAVNALRLAESILVKIKEHAELVAETIRLRT